MNYKWYARRRVKRRGIAESDVSGLMAHSLQVRSIQNLLPMAVGRTFSR